MFPDTVVELSQINTMYVIDFFLYPPENIRKPEVFWRFQWV